MNEETYRGGRELTRAQVPGVPAGGVGGPTTHLLRVAGSLVGLGQLLGTRLQVGVPAEPAAVAGVDVHDDVGQGAEHLQRVGDAVAVAGGGVLAGRLVAVGGQVGQRVGLDEQREGRVGVLLEQRDDGVDVLRLVLADLSDLQLTVGGLGIAVTARKIVDDETQDVVAGGVRDRGLDLGDVLDVVAVLPLVSVAAEKRAIVPVK